jgi:hypothetical protein
MKKKIFLMLSMAILLVCIFVMSISAETVISENNIDENGDIVADVLLDLGNNTHIVSVDISYTDANGQVKDGKFYYENNAECRPECKLAVNQESVFSEIHYKRDDLKKYDHHDSNDIHPDVDSDSEIGVIFNAVNCINEKSGHENEQACKAMCQRRVLVQAESVS